MNIMPCVYFFSSHVRLPRLLFLSVSRLGHSGAHERQPDALPPTLVAHLWTFVPHAVQAHRGGHVLRRSDCGRVLEGASLRRREGGKQKEGINVLSVITLYDINLQPRTSPPRTDAVLPPIPLFFYSHPRVNHLSDDGACWIT
jgi:hypothetical protein